MTRNDPRALEELGHREWLTRILLAVLSLLLLMIVYGIWVTDQYGGVTGAGVFGDMFGAANAFFSGLALMGIVYAIALQQRELQLQRNELMRLAEAGAESNAVRLRQLQLSERADAERRNHLQRTIEPSLHVEEVGPLVDLKQEVILVNEGGQMHDIVILVPPVGIQLQFPRESSVNRQGNLKLGVIYTNSETATQYSEDDGTFFTAVISFANELGIWEIRSLRLQPGRKFVYLGPDRNAPVKEPDLPLENAQVL